MFFCKYNDPIYVKMEKLEIIIRLASDRNIDQVLLELKEYAQEVRRGEGGSLGCLSARHPHHAVVDARVCSDSGSSPYSQLQ